MKNLKLPIVIIALLVLSSCSSKKQHATIVDGKGSQHEVKIAPSKIGTVDTGQTITAYQTRYMSEPVYSLASSTASLSDSANKGVIRGRVIALSNY